MRSDLDVQHRSMLLGIRGWNTFQKHIRDLNVQNRFRLLGIRGWNAVQKNNFRREQIEMLLSVAVK
jgi:hypothetical protein